MRGTKIVFLLLITLFLGSCTQSTLPKPKGYMRIDLPQKETLVFEHNEYPVTFEMPNYVRVEPVVGASNNEKWFNLVFKPFNARLYISYSKLDNDLNNHIESNHKLTYEHQVKASAIKTTKIIEAENQVFGLKYNLKGNVATPFQFYLTDSSNHFLRASFYFDFKANYDSLAPVVKFLEEDVNHFISTLKWVDNTAK
jgi:gliding motility-associated lipoprotein GldD